MFFYEEDVARWEQERAGHILRRLHVIQAPPGGIHNGWKNPDTGADEISCPFLDKDAGFRCAVYHTRPLVCRHFVNGGAACRELRQKHQLPV
ncbi:MAG: YkgJ family cysteine cluster protein [Blastocatellia bacterium]